MVPSVVEQLDLPDELDFDALVLQLAAGFLQADVHLPRNRLAVIVEEELLLLAVLDLHFCGLSVLLAVEVYVDVGRLAETQKALVREEIHEYYIVTFWIKEHF